MRKIKITGAYSKIQSIRIHIVENALLQIRGGEGFDFTQNEYLARIGELRKNKTKFLDLISSISAKEAEECLEHYHLQDNEIRKNFFSVSKIEIPEAVSNLLEFVYEYILFWENYWNGLHEWSFSKMLFKKEFFKSQGHWVCPYCDSMENFELLNFEIDHLLPKTEFSLLGIHEMNLFPCCTTCNHQHYGKGNRWNEHYLNLFENAVGHKVQFEFEPEFKIIGLDKTSDDFLSLIQLKHRSTDWMLADSIEIQKKKVFKDLKKDRTNTTFLDENAPFYFLTKALYNFYSAHHFEP